VPAHSDSGIGMSQFQYIEIFQGEPAFSVGRNCVIIHDMNNISKDTFGQVSRHIFNVFNYNLPDRIWIAEYSDNYIEQW
jgi:hypothetical protein